MTTTVKYMGKGITPDNNRETVKILKEIPAAQVQVPQDVSKMTQIRAENEIILKCTQEEKKP